MVHGDALKGTQPHDAYNTLALSSPELIVRFRELERFATRVVRYTGLCFAVFRCLVH